MASILLTGDVMIGRGVDQILPFSGDPVLYESFMSTATGYVALAEARSGPIPRRASLDYVWGDALEMIRRADLRIINLETALTCCPVPAPKGINYRCHPANAPVLGAAAIDCCVLANNHVLDWSEAGLLETLDTLDSAGMSHAGAGRDKRGAEAPAVMPLAGGKRVLVFAFGMSSAGVPGSWSVGQGLPGVYHFDDFDRALERLAEQVAAEKMAGDIVIVSVHWGPNWGYEIPDSWRRFAHRLIDEAGADIIHGHSSHHPKAVELHHGKPILYGCGDFLNDYEGISGMEEFRAELVLAYRAEMDPGGSCRGMDLLPFRISRFRLNAASEEEAKWMTATLDRQCRPLGGRVTLDRTDHRFMLHLSPMAA